jgi:hypothetical protein
MLRKLPLVVALVVMVVILLLLSREDVGDMGRVAEEREAVTSPVFLPENMAGTEGMSVEPAEPVAVIEETEAPTRQKVFRLVLDGERCVLEAMEEVSGQKYLTLTVPRRAKRTDVSYTAEVSGNLSSWDSGSGHTVVVEDSATLLVVRDASPIGATSRRAMRLKVSAP